VVPRMGPCGGGGRVADRLALSVAESRSDRGKVRSTRLLMPVPAANTMSARYRCGTASMRCATTAVSSGTISRGSFLGNVVLSHGEELTFRSRMAALKIAATIPWMTCTVAGDSLPVSLVTHAWISLGLIVASRRWPKYGYTCRRKLVSTCAWVAGRCTWARRHDSAYSRNVVGSFGST
jgi:hypothetical protein